MASLHGGGVLRTDIDELAHQFVQPVHVWDENRNTLQPINVPSVSVNTGADAIISISAHGESILCERYDLRDALGLQPDRSGRSSKLGYYQSPKLVASVSYDGL